MYKKLMVPFVLAMIAALVLSTAAFAAPLPSGTIRRVGTILSVNMAANTFKFDTLTGVHYTIHVDSATVYTGTAHGLGSLTSLERVNLEIRQRSDGTWWAVRVRGIPRSLEVVKERGTVTAVGASSFTISDRGDRDSDTFLVTSATRFMGKDVPHLRDLKIGMVVTVSYRGIIDTGVRALSVVIDRR